MAENSGMTKKYGDLKIDGGLVLCPHAGEGCVQTWPLPKNEGNEPRGYAWHVDACDERTPEERKAASAKYAQSTSKKKQTQREIDREVNTAIAGMDEAMGTHEDEKTKAAAMVPATEKAKRQKRGAKTYPIKEVPAPASGSPAVTTSPEVKADAPTPAPVQAVEVQEAAPAPSATPTPPPPTEVQASKPIPPLPPVPVVPTNRALEEEPIAGEIDGQNCVFTFARPVANSPVLVNGNFVEYAEGGCQILLGEPPPRGAKVVARHPPPQPAPPEQTEAIKFEAAKEEALRSYTRTTDQIMKDYGVQLVALDQEMTTTVEKVEVIGNGNRVKHLGWKEKGLGVTLSQHLAKHRTYITKAKDPAALGEHLRKAESVALDVALYLWAKGSATGPTTALSLSKAAQAAERLADALEKMGKVVNAQQQRERAARLLAQAERAQKGLPIEHEQIKPKIQDAQAVDGQPKPVAVLKPCLCGCGAETKSSFRPGHDSRVHGLAKKIARGQSKDHLPMGAVEYVQRSNWLTKDEMAAFLTAHGIKP